MTKVLLAATVLIGAKPLLAADIPDPGARLYRDGRLASGEPLRATVGEGVEVAGAQAACARCHRRSGLGGSEGSRSIRPIAGRLLFEPPDPASLPRSRTAVPRPVYDRAALARALREGVDPTGRRLDPLMPRYELGDEAVAQLEAHLRSLAPATQPGVSDAEIHFATVVAPDVDPAKSRAMLDVLHTFFADKNAGTRSEVRRKAAGAMRMQKAYRRWALHVWELAGPPDTWRAQLEAHYARQPVFALLGGIGAGTWRPVHEFCEGREIPCLFPDVDFPVVSGENHYSIYYSRGVTLEAEVLATHLAGGTEPIGPVFQVFRGEALGGGPARTLREALARRGIATVDRIPREAVPSSAFWRDLLREAQGRPLVLWLDGDELAELPGVDEAPPAGIYLSASLLAMRRPPLPGSWLEHTRLAWPFAITPGWEEPLVRMKLWLRARNIPVGDERAQANAYFAASTVGEVLMEMVDNFSRDYLIERIEHMTGRSLFPSVYPRLSLGPGQRFASKGAYVARFSPDGKLVADGEWIVP